MGDLLFQNLMDTCLKAHNYNSQYKYAKELYLKEIKEFFNNCIFQPEFPSDLLVQKINPVLTFGTYEEIPPKLMYDFCEKFGFYTPTVDYLEPVDAAGLLEGWRVYKFTKKVDWE